MKKLLLVGLVVALFVVSILLHPYKKQALVKEAQKQATSFMKSNYEKVDTVTINPDNYTFYPKDLGGYLLTGISMGTKFFNFRLIMRQKVIS